LDFTLVIPAFNEASRIRATLEAYAPEMQAQDARLHIVVNGTEDDTEAIIRKEFLPRFSCIQLTVIPEQIGKGGALMRGFRDAETDLVGYVDADGSSPPEALFHLIEELGEAPGLIIGSRWMPESRIDIPQPWSRQLASRVFNLLVRILFGMKIHDTQCGAKVMHRSVIREVLPNIGSTQWAFDVELIFHARRLGYPIREVPVAWDDREGSKVRMGHSALQMTLALTRLRLLYSPLKGVVAAWDRGPGRRLYDKRLVRMKNIYRKSGQ